MSVIRDHKLRHQAQLAAAKAAATGQVADATADSLHLQLIALEDDIARLRRLDRIADRVELKRTELLPKYRPFVEAYLAEGKTHSNPVLATITCWLFDVGELETGIAWALRCIELGQSTPDNIKRDWPHFVADTVLEWAEPMAADGHSVEPYFSQVLELVDGSWKLNEQLTAKWFKAAGLNLLRGDDGKPNAALIADTDRLNAAGKWLAKAGRVWPNIGVKTQLERINMRMRAIVTGNL